MLSLTQLLMIPDLLLLLLIISLPLFSSLVESVNWIEPKWHHTSTRLQDCNLRKIAITTITDYEHFNVTLDNILVPRHPGTIGNKQVQQYIKSELGNLGWTIEEDSFEDSTPHGKKPFTNIVATLNPSACRHLTIACHYDSKYMQNHTFVGAVDSAVPCSMMMHAAKRLDSSLKDRKKKDNELTLQFIFFDGEEAFQEWSKTDSLYGSRHLAALWNRMPPFPHGLNGVTHCANKGYASYLDKMDVMVLLDLIGSANPTFYSYFSETHQLYSKFVEIELRLNALHLLEESTVLGSNKYFKSQKLLASVQDDHVPFLEKGVPIVHLIPKPFPQVWHSERDIRENLHQPTINDLNKILRVFIAEYLHLGR